MAVPVLQNSEVKDITLGSGTQSTSLSVHASANFLVIKHASFHGPGATDDEPITAMRLNGTPLSFAVHDVGQIGAHERVSIWYLANPSTGTQTLEIDYTSDGNMFGSSLVAEYWSGANASIGEVHGQYNVGTLTDDTCTISAVTTDGVTVDICYANIFTALTPDTGQTPVQEGTFTGASERVGTSYEAGELNMKWTFLTATRVAHCAIEIKSTGGPAALSISEQN